MLAEDDFELMLREMDRFCRSRLAHCIEYPESPITTEALTQATCDLEDLGLLSLNDANGMGLWQDTATPAVLSFNIELLRQAARISGGVAFYWHRLALAGRLLQHTGLVYEGPLAALTLQPQGHYGLARKALPAWLSGASLVDGLDQTILDWVDFEQHWLSIHASPEWQGVLVPQWEDGLMQWALHSREDMVIDSKPAAAGFDELATFHLHAPPSMTRSQLQDADARRIHRELLTLDAIGLMAIALGSLERAQTLAHTYSRERRQGGARIIEHPAVRLMLADISGATSSAESILRQLAASALDLAATLRLRATVHPLLCRGANQAIQVHGGIGYMRDCGVEKVWREQLTLRRVNGTPMELHLLTAALEEWA